jgi:hypothetical protein
VFLGSGDDCDDVPGLLDIACPFLRGFTQLYRGFRAGIHGLGRILRLLCGACISYT